MGEEGKEKMLLQSCPVFLTLELLTAQIEGIPKSPSSADNTAGVGDLEMSYSRRTLLKGNRIGLAKHISHSQNRNCLRRFIRRPLLNSKNACSFHYQRHNKKFFS